MRNPLVSIIIPTFNRSKLILETINSVKAQSFSNWECIVIDDRSEDDTSLVLKRICEEDQRFIFVKREKFSKNGASVCRNIGLLIAKGKYIQFLDSDDLMSTNKLKSQIEILEANKDVSIVTCKWGRFEKKLDDSEVYHNLKSYQKFYLPKKFFGTLPASLNFFPIHAYLIRKELINKAGFWNEYIYFNDDAEFMCRVISNSEIIEFAEDAVVYYRRSTINNVSSYEDPNKIQNGINSWKLIELYLRIVFGEDINYVQKGKVELYKHLNEFPSLIERNYTFFKDQILREKKRIGIRAKIRFLLKRIRA